MDIRTAPKGREEMRLDILKTTLEPDNISVYWILSPPSVLKTYQGACLNVLTLRHAIYGLLKGIYMVLLILQTVTLNWDW
ncbi:hypothetical protein NC653_003147 [Populus alba x Populus x berolinensis]|uniref:Uncharacterized protein n=1 Tax=Populus alba x Populus x berolinensis TaxID=444605 RepID=A0AAD6WIS8_9ROSI|nr:hypothetical protein NC653_003147 [Populus alba x Populus x berolinensis]